ncbi:uncharacterized protein LOC141902379 [Tubulanus polymorphus]|uniref:uncharacterized protein LOC141902379 n=1 Tax=Tubulanus polymorphus TaxID=672921 RepID=UPI003DA497D0
MKVTILLCLALLMVTVAGAIAAESNEESLLAAFFKRVMEKIEMEKRRKRCKSEGRSCRSSKQCCPGKSCQFSMIGTWSSKICLDPQASDNLNNLPEPSCINVQIDACNRSKAATNCRRYLEEVGRSDVSCSKPAGRKFISKNCGGFDAKTCY